MRRLASGNVDDDEDDMIDDYDSEDDDEDISNAARKLNVFCVSSAEFLKIKFPKRSKKDGPPTVSASFAIQERYLNDNPPRVAWN